MKLNSLIKYDSLKLLSLFGYIFITMLFFLRFETVRLYSSANNVDPEIAEFVLEMFFAIVCFVGTTAVLIIVFLNFFTKNTNQRTQ